jgi:capsular polysaccharide biosynthesis protein/Mrp family chromosome partitioning ATPase
MNPIQRPDSFELADYTGVLRRRWAIVLVVTIIGVVGAFAYTLVAPKTYTAMAAVFVSATAADQGSQVANSRTGGQVNLDTEAQLVTSGTVSAIAVKTLHSPLTPYVLSREINVTVPPNSQVLNIGCSASSGAGAAACANAFASAYLQNRTSSAATTIATRVKALQARQASLVTTISALNAQAKGLSKTSSKRPAIQAKINADRSQLTSLNPQITALIAAGTNVNGGKVITAATAPAKPSSPKKSLVLPSGLAAGLVIGLIIAFIWDRRDKRIHRAQDVERFLDIPVMLSLPGDAFGRQVSIAAPRSGTGRGFTELAHDVSATLGEGSHVVLVTGVSPGPAGSVAAANLAATLARTHPEVVLVCADMKGSVGSEMAGLDDGRGLAEVVSGEASVREVVRAPAALPGLWVISPGAETSAAYMQHDRAKSLIAQLRRDARFVIIEAQASDEGADTFAFAEFADAAVIVVEMDRTTRDEALDCVRRLERLRTTVIGVAVLPAIGRRIKVRPPRQPQPQQRDWQDEPASDPGRRNPAMPAMSTAPGASPDKRDRTGRYQEEYRDPADRIREN